MTKTLMWDDYVSYQTQHTRFLQLLLFDPPISYNNCTISSSSRISTLPKHTSSTPLKTLIYTLLTPQIRSPKNPRRVITFFAASVPPSICTAPISASKVLAIISCEMRVCPGFNKMHLCKPKAMPRAWSAGFDRSVFLIVSHDTPTRWKLACNHQHMRHMSLNKTKS
jgi:hypothetical protein